MTLPVTRFNTNWRTEIEGYDRGVFYILPKSETTATD